MKKAAAAGPSLALLLSVFAVAMSVLGFEVSLTRAFSVLLRFHFVFLVISLATCGLGLGGLADFLLCRGPRRRLPPEPTLTVFGSLCALLMPTSYLLLFASPLSAKLTSVWVVSGICLPPFLAAGGFLSHAFSWHSSHGGRLYFADLVGASLGSFLVIAALQLLGGINAGLLWGAVVGAGTLVLVVASGRRALALLPAAAVLATLALLVANRTGALVSLPVMPLAEDPNAKPLFQELGDPQVGARIVATRWNAFARTDVVSNRGLGDLFVYTDGEVPTNLIPFDGDLPRVLPRLERFLGFFAFQQVRPRSALLIGPGGGLDILLALATGTDRIDGVELNPSIPELVRGPFAGLTGHVYDLQGVDVRVDEGRSFVNRSHDRYDLIYSALTKTATTASSSLALVESYIYTTEAFGQYLDHLTDRGSFAFVCQNDLILLRAMLTAVQALQQQGEGREAALGHICLLSVPRGMMAGIPYRYMMLLSRRPLGEPRARELATHCIAQGWEPIFFPGCFEPEPFARLTAGGMSDQEFQAWWNDWQGRSGDGRMDFGPCPDDRPFVVDMGVGVPRQFLRFLWLAVALVPLLTVAALTVVARRPGARLPGAARLGGGALYFCLLGVAFMLVEVVLTQRLVLYLGYPVLTLSVILFSLLLGGGLGSLWSQSWLPGRGLAWRAGAAALVAACGALAIQALHPHLVQATLAWNIQLRCAVTMALLMPLGFVMGTPFPTGIRVVGAWAQDLVPWMWGLNGVTSVVGSVGAMAVAKLHGFSAVLAVGAAVYALAGALALAHGLTWSRAPKHAPDHAVESAPGQAPEGVSGRGENGAGVK